MHTSRRLIAFPLTSLLIGIGSVYADETPITPDEIKSTWVGKTMVIQSTAGQAAEWQMKADGTVQFDAVGLRGSLSDTGTWRLSKEGYCTKYKVIRSGAERCFTAIKSSAGFTVFNPDKSIAGYVRIKN